MTITARKGDPVLSRDGSEIVARFDRSLHIEGEYFEWTWHADISPIKFDYRGELGDIPANRGCICCVFGRGGPIQIWQVVALNGDTKNAFHVPPFKPEVAAPGPDPAGMISAIDELSKHCPMPEKYWLSYMRERYEYLREREEEGRNR